MPEWFSAAQLADVLGVPWETNSPPPASSRTRPYYEARRLQRVEDVARGGGLDPGAIPFDRVWYIAARLGLALPPQFPGEPPPPPLSDPGWIEVGELAAALGVPEIGRDVLTAARVKPRASQRANGKVLQQVAEADVWAVAERLGVALPSRFPAKPPPKVNAPMTGYLPGQHPRLVANVTTALRQRDLAQPGRSGITP